MYVYNMCFLAFPRFQHLRAMRQSITHTTGHLTQHYSWQAAPCIHDVFEGFKFASLQTEALHKGALLADTQEMADLGQDLDLSKTHGTTSVDNCHIDTADVQLQTTAVSTGENS